MVNRTIEHSGRTSIELPERARSRIVELRQYTLHPGQRDVLIDLFEREFVEGQEALGMEVIGQFRDLDDPNRFVWLRGFHDMPSRAEALTAFYDGPVWAAHRDVANPTMIDSDNVLLLRPAHPASGFSLDYSDRPPPGATGLPQGLVVATIYQLDSPADADFVAVFERALMPVLTATGAAIVASFVTENSANNFPRHPVREGEHVFVWFAHFADVAAYELHLAALAQSRRGGLPDALARHLTGTEVLKLLPAARSKLHG